jgi:hypothetical protein
MMEFFLSKIWVFVVGIFLLGVLLQGVNMQAQAERSSALQQMAENIQELFESMGNVGPGMERTIEMSEFLSSSLTLTVTKDYAALNDDGETYIFTISVNVLLIETSSGELEQIEVITLGAESVMMLVTEEPGLTMIAFNPRTCPSDTLRPR